MEETTKKFNFSEFHKKNYKLLLTIPAILLILSFVYLGIFYSENSEFFHKDISLTGGTVVTVLQPIDSDLLISNLESQLEDLNVITVSDIFTGEEKAVIIETKTSPEETKSVLEGYLGFTLNEENSSFEFTGPTLGESFFKQLIIAIIAAFFFMAIVVFLLFRTLIPSAAVIISALADIIMTLAVVDLLGMKISSAGIVAFLMLIGYSVDTDILLTNRVLKRRELPLEERFSGAFKTGITMTFTSLVAVSVALFFVNSFSIVLSQIFTILVIGLVFDLLNTWITNVSILRWYVEVTEK